MKKPRLRVSDHCVLRYLERVGGFDVERLRREIGQRCDAAAAVGACGVKIGGMSFRIKDSADGPVVTTVLDEDWFPRNHQRNGGEV
jgi:hypothetical protein